MVIKGVSCAGARRLAVHLMRTDTNERAEVKELHGVAAENLRGALLEMEAVASGARTKKPFYHASINTRADERLTDEQRNYAIDRLESALGLTGQARVVVVHQKEGREHCHIVWCRIDLGRMAAISDSHNYRKHEEVSRALEREFGHERVQGAHVEREGKERPERTPSHAEMLQADRTGLSPKQVKEEITALWHSTDSGQAFAVALWQAGYVLARGDRRDYVVLDPRGGTHSLARRVEGVRVKDIRERMSDLEPARLPGIEDAKQIQRARQVRDAARAIPDRQPPNSMEIEEDSKSKRSVGADLEWTDRAGMVAQQRSALEWVRKSGEMETVRTQPSNRTNDSTDTQKAISQRRQRLLGDFVRNGESDLAGERGVSRDRDRSR